MNTGIVQVSPRRISPAIAGEINKIFHMKMNKYKLQSEYIIVIELH